MQWTRPTSTHATPHTHTTEIHCAPCASRAQRQSKIRGTGAFAAGSAWVRRGSGVGLRRLCRLGLGRWGLKLPRRALARAWAQGICARLLTCRAVCFVSTNAWACTRGCLPCCATGGLHTTGQLGGRAQPVLGKGPVAAAGVQRQTHGADSRYVDRFAFSSRLGNLSRGDCLAPLMCAVAPPLPPRTTGPGTRRGPRPSPPRPAQAVRPGPVCAREPGCARARLRDSRCRVGYVGDASPTPHAPWQHFSGSPLC